MPGPWYSVVRFQAFDESALDFELFCHLRDVEKRIDARSDIKFLIDNALRKHGVAIPFTIHFGGAPKQPNFLPIVPGWKLDVPRSRTC